MKKAILLIYAGMKSCARRTKDKDFSVILGFTYFSMHFLVGILLFFFYLFNINISTIFLIIFCIILGFVIYLTVKRHYLENKEKVLMLEIKYFKNELKAVIFISTFIIFTGFSFIPGIYLGSKLSELLNLSRW